MFLCAVGVSTLTIVRCSYNSRTQNISVYDVALHRSVAVIAGVLWALIVSRIWWPSEARRELGVGLSDFLLNLGWLYNRLVMTYSVPPEALSQIGSHQIGIGAPIVGSTAALVDDITSGLNERTGLLGAALATGINTNIRDFMAMFVIRSHRPSCFLTARQGVAFANQADPSPKVAFPSTFGLGFS